MQSGEAGDLCKRDALVLVVPTGDRTEHAVLTVASSCPLGIAAMLELGNKPGLLELTHGAQIWRTISAVGEGSVK